MTIELTFENFYREGAWGRYFEAKRGGGGRKGGGEGGGGAVTREEWPWRTTHSVVPLMKFLKSQGYSPFSHLTE